MGKILIVEDQEELRHIIGLNLIKNGHVVVEAADGEDAKARLIHEPFDLVITDIRMPRLDGFGLLQWIKQNKPTPVFLMTGFPGIALERSDEVAQAERFFEKPFTADELTNAVEEQLEKSKRKEDETSSRPIYWITTALSIVSAVIGMYVVIAPIQRKKSNTDYVRASVEFSKELKDEINAMRTKVNSLTQEPKPLPLQALGKEIAGLDSRLKSIENIILVDPEKAMSQVLIRRELNELSRETQYQLASMRKDLDFIWEVRIWIFSIVLALVGLLVTYWTSNPSKRRKK